ncbi:Osmotin thaumatin-like protein [Boletus coccyginus]|nr:Osmotin thaumatin-like protein [Boletus coccyginus]
MSLLSTLALTALVTVAQAQSLTINNKCSKSVFLFTQTSYGSIKNNMNIGSGASVNMDIRLTFIGTGCNSAGSCTTGGPTWSGMTSFSRVEFNFWAIPGSVTYDISLIYGYNVGMKISLANTGCKVFACTISSSCPIPGPDGSCYSPCCSSTSTCSSGALPAWGGGCVNNASPGPYSSFYYGTCYNMYAFPDNNSASGYKPANVVDYTCHNNTITLTLCPGIMLNYH